jgi:hypothetical protein
MEACTMTTDLRAKAESLRALIPERRQSTPPEENGRRLASMARSETEEIRVNWSSYEGRPFLSVRLWTKDNAGQWWPDKARGMSIRIRELPDLADALSEAIDLAEEHMRNRGPGPNYRGPHRPPAHAPTFDEFHESR